LIVSRFINWAKRANPTAQKALAVAKELGVSLYWLLTGEYEEGSLTDDEAEILRVYRDIPKLGKARALKQLKETLEREREIEADVQARADAKVEAALAEGTKAASGA
jgi:transcriptional regulator with XRE-family HTH domain